MSPVKDKIQIQIRSPKDNEIAHNATILKHSRFLETFLLA